MFKEDAKPAKKAVTKKKEDSSDSGSSTSSAPSEKSTLGDLDALAGLKEKMEGKK
jgi:small subunit ribosomal protein S1